MDQEAVIGSIKFTLEPTLKPWEDDPEQFVTEIEGRIAVMAEDDDEIFAGKISLIMVKINEAEVAGVNLYHVFDYSASLEATYSSVFDARGRLRKRFKINRDVDTLIYINSIRWKRGLGGMSVLEQSVETASAIFAPSGLVLAYAKDLNRFGLNWRQYGFMPTGVSGLILRDNFEFPLEEMATWLPPEDSPDENDFPRLPTSD